MEKEIEKLMRLVSKSRQYTLNEALEKIKKTGKTWGGYDDGNVVDDKEAFAYNNALSDIEQLINDMKQMSESIGYGAGNPEIGNVGENFDLMNCPSIKALGKSEKEEE